MSAALTEILRDDLNVDISRVTPESRLVDDVGLDSVAFAVGMVAIEDKLGVAVSEQELLGCDTVGDLERRHPGKGPGRPVSVLATALSGAMRASAHDLVVFDKEADAWKRHPWPQVHARAESVAARILDEPQRRRGRPGRRADRRLRRGHPGRLAGRAERVDPARAGPRRRPAAVGAGDADPVRRPRRAHGVQPRPRTRTCCSGARRAADRARRRRRGAARTRRPPSRPSRPRPGTPAVLQGTAGSTGNPRTAQLSAEAVLNNVNGLLTRFGVDPAVDGGCTWLPLYHDMGLTFLLSGALSRVAGLAGAHRGVHRVAVPVAALAQRKRGDADRRAEHGLQHDRQVRPAGVRRRPRPGAGVAINGGEPVDCAAMERFANALSTFGFDAGALAPSYGLAESTCAVTIPAPGTGLLYDEIDSSATDSEPRRHAMLGAPIPGMEVRIGPASEHSAEVPGRDVGEIEIRGTSMMSGYLGDTPLRARRLVPDRRPGLPHRRRTGGLRARQGDHHRRRPQRLSRRDRTGRRRNPRCA